MDGLKNLKGNTLTIGIVFNDNTDKENYHINCQNVATVLGSLGESDNTRKLKQLEKINIKESGKISVPDLDELVDDNNAEGVSEFSQLLNKLAEYLDSLKLVNVERILNCQNQVNHTAVDAFLNKLDDKVEVKGILEFVEKPALFPVHDDKYYNNLRVVKMTAEHSRNLLYGFEGRTKLPPLLDRFELNDTNPNLMNFELLKDCKNLYKISITANYNTFDWLPPTITKLTIRNYKQSPLFTSKPNNLIAHNGVKFLTLDIRHPSPALESIKFPKVEMVTISGHQGGSNRSIQKCLSESKHIHVLALANKTDLLNIVEYPETIRILNLSLLENVYQEADSCLKIARQYSKIQSLELSQLYWSTALVIAFFKCQPEVQISVKLEANQKAILKRVKETGICKWGVIGNSTLTLKLGKGLGETKDSAPTNQTLNKAAKEINEVISAYEPLKI